MATKLGVILADFATSLATAIAVGGTTATLQSATDDDGIAIPSGRYFFALDGENSNKEHISCDLVGTALTNIKSLSRQGVEAAGVVRAHRIGCTVTLTDFAHIKFINDYLIGTTNLPAGTPLSYDGTASITTANQLATKAYVDGVAIAGAPDASATVKGITKMSVAPASPTAPIAVGDNDGRVPTQAQRDALVGTGTPAAGNPFVTQDTLVARLPTGAVLPFAGFTAPSGFLLADGSAVSRSGANAALFALLVPNLGNPTMTIASPCVVSLTAHGLLLNDVFYFTTTGALPTGVSANTLYHVISAGLTANAFQFSATEGGAAVNSSGSQSGTHSLFRCPYGLGDGSTTFNVPNMKGKIAVGLNTSDTEFNAIGKTFGEKTHQLTVAELAAHTHKWGAQGNATGGPNGPAQNGSSLYDTGSAGSDTPHNNIQPSLVLQHIIKL